MRKGLNFVVKNYTGQLIITGLPSFSVTKLKLNLIILIIRHNNKIYVWRKSDERLRPECLGVRSDRETQCRASVMFYGCISYYGVGTLKVVNGNLNSDK